MKQSVLAGVVLAVLVALWTLVMGVTGWYKNPIAAMLFYLVIPINVAVVVWGLYRTKSEGRRYGGQVVAGVVIGLVAAVLIFGNSLLFTQDGKTLVTSSVDRTVRFWDVATSQLRFTLRVGFRVTRIAMSEDGKTLAACGSTGGIRLWRAATKEEVGATDW